MKRFFTKIGNLIKSNKKLIICVGVSSLLCLVLIIIDKAIGSAWLGFFSSILQVVTVGIALAGWLELQDRKKSRIKFIQDFNKTESERKIAIFVQIKTPERKGFYKDASDFLKVYDNGSFYSKAEPKEKDDVAKKRDLESEFWKNDENKNKIGVFTIIKDKDAKIIYIHGENMPMDNMKVTNEYLSAFKEVFKGVIEDSQSMGYSMFYLFYDGPGSCLYFLRDCFKNTTANCLLFQCNLNNTKGKEYTYIPLGE